MVITMSDKKTTRRRKRKQIQLSQQESNLGLCFTDSPTRFLCVGNGGMSNGITPTLLKHLLPGSDFKLFMPRRSSVAFVDFRSITECQEVFLNHDGVCVQNIIEKLGLQHLVSPSFLTGPPIHLYLFFVTAIPVQAIRSSTISSAASNADNFSLPQGLSVLYDFITLGEELALLEYFHPAGEPKNVHSTQPNESIATVAASCVHHHEHAITQVSRTGVEQTGSPYPSDNQLLPHGSQAGDQNKCAIDKDIADEGFAASFNDCSKVLRLRTVKHFGYEFLYGSNTVDLSHPLPGGIPTLCTPLLKSIVSSGLVDHTPDQLTVNIYEPGAGERVILPA